MKKLSGAAKRFNFVTQMLGRSALKPGSEKKIERATRLLAKLTLMQKRAQKKEDVTGLTREWLRMFPREICSIEKVEDETGYGLVHADCSLVGTGDLKACYRMMEYDRALVEKMGGQLVVLESRANPAVKGRCKVAIRMKEDKRADLIPAHNID